MSDREENEKPQYRYVRRKKNKEGETQNMINPGLLAMVLNS